MWTNIIAAAVLFLGIGLWIGLAIGKVAKPEDEWAAEAIAVAHDQVAP